MLKGLKKEQPVYQTPQAETQSITCGACRYERKSTDKCPDWQCPGCGKAYAKVNIPQKDQNLSPQQQYNKDFAQRLEQQKSDAEQKEAAKNVASIGASTGALILAKGLGKAASACVKVAIPANPVLIALGGLILAGSAIYAALKFLL